MRVQYNREKTEESENKRIIRNNNENRKEGVRKRRERERTQKNYEDGHTC